MIVSSEELEELDRVLILAPYRRDSEYLSRLLLEHDIKVDVVSAVDDVAHWLATSPGVVIATHEALAPAMLATVGNYLHAQPSWSEMPIVVLLDRASPNSLIRAELDRAWPRARLLLYQRPVTRMELVSGVQSALLARLRQREVRNHMAREMELRHELNHRVKNILASVVSIFEMTRRGAISIEEFSDNYRGRLNALAKVHSAVFQSDGEMVPLREIAELTFDPYRSSEANRIIVQGPEVTLTRESGTTLALCLHELTTNAIKYGALSVPEGRVEFEWRLSRKRPTELSVEWRERGGPVVEKSIRAGYGTRYLGLALAAMFGQKPIITFAPDGLRCEVRGALSRIGETGISRPRYSA